MDTEELIRKCKAISIREGAERKLTLRSGIEEKGGRIMANSMIGKLLLSRSVHTESIRSALVQAWRTTKEVKIESLGNNIFIFKFGLEVDKRKVLAGGPWHFDRALIVLKEPSGIGNMRKQAFTHVAFWIQIHNVPLACMERDNVQKLGGLLGEVLEVETDDEGECIGLYARVRVSIDITKSLQKMVFLELEDEDDEVELPVLYERLPDFCFCCGIIGHQFKECSAYNGQPKEKLPYGVYMRALSKAEKTKLNRGRDRWNRRAEHPFTKSRGADFQGRNQPQQDDSNPSTNELETNQPGSGETEDQATRADKHLMQMTLEPRKQQDTRQKQPSLMTAENSADSTEVYNKGGKELWEDTSNKLAPNLEPKQTLDASLSQESGDLNLEGVIDNGPSSKALRPKRRKWKLQARSARNKGNGKKRLIVGKRPACDSIKQSPSHKRTRIQSPQKIHSAKTNSCNLLSSRYTLNWDGTEVEEETNLTHNKFQAAEAEDQPRRQP